MRGGRAFVAAARRRPGGQILSTECVVTDMLCKSQGARAGAESKEAGWLVCRRSWQATAIRRSVPLGPPRLRPRPSQPAGACSWCGARARARDCTPRCSSAPCHSHRRGAGRAWRRSSRRHRCGAGGSWLALPLQQQPLPRAPLHHSGAEPPWQLQQVRAGAREEASARRDHEQGRRPAETPREQCECAALLLPTCGCAAGGGSHALRRGKGRGRGGCRLRH